MDAYLHRTFVKKYKRLPSKVQKQFDDRLELLLAKPTDPLLNNHAVERAFPDCRSINVTGDYRAIFKLDGETAIFINIGTHTELY